MAGKTVNVTEIIDERGFGRFQLGVTFWCGLLILLDGFDIGTTAYVVPTVAPLWHITPAAFSQAFLSTLVGVLIGTLASGPLADRYGRKKVILLSALTFAIFELATIPVSSLMSFIVVRFLTGLGIGGLMPISIAMTAEYAPRRIRTTVTAIMYLGFPLGVGIAGFAAAELIPVYGWQAMFVVGGALPLLLLPVVIFTLPESIRFLVARGGSPARIATLLNWLTQSTQYDAADQFGIAEEKTAGFTVKELFTEGRAASTVLLWVIFFCNLLVIYFLSAWLPTILSAAGVPIGAASRLTGALSLGGVVGILLLGPLVDKIGATRVVRTLYVAAAICIFGIGFSGDNITLLAITITACGGCITSSQSFSNVLAARLYPTTMRSTGVAWALGIGRAGTLLGPVVGGLMLNAHFDTRTMFFSTAIPAVIAAIAMFILGQRLRAETKDPAAS
jgi:AAHS family 4-hydroxybenzoate transporter-like MFS transporter